MINTALPSPSPFNALASALEGFARAKRIEVHTSKSVETMAPVVYAKKGGYEFYCEMHMFMSIEEFFGEVAHLFYELDQHAKGLWTTEDEEDQLQFNFNLIKIMEEHKNDQETYPIKMQRLQQEVRSEEAVYNQRQA